MYKWLPSPDYCLTPTDLSPAGILVILEQFLWFQIEKCISCCFYEVVVIWQYLPARPCIMSGVIGPIDLILQITDGIKLIRALRKGQEKNRSDDQHEEWISLHLLNPGLREKYYIITTNLLRTLACLKREMDHEMDCGYEKQENPGLQLSSADDSQARLVRGSGP